MSGITARIRQLTKAVTADDQVKAYIKKIMSQLKEWMYGGKISKLVVVITSKETGEHVERWQFDVSQECKFYLDPFLTTGRCKSLGRARSPNHPRRRRIRRTVYQSESDRSWYWLVVPDKLAEPTKALQRRRKKKYRLRSSPSSVKSRLRLPFCLC